MTQVPTSCLGALIVPPSGRVLPAIVFNAWSHLKSRQVLEDGTSATITPEREAILAAMPSALPRLGPALVTDLDAATARALPRTREAIAKRLGMSPKGGTSA